MHNDIDDVPFLAISKNAKFPPKSVCLLTNICPCAVSSNAPAMQLAIKITEYMLESVFRSVVGAREEDEREKKKTLYISIELD